MQNRTNRRFVSTTIHLHKDYPRVSFFWTCMLLSAVIPSVISDFNQTSDLYEDLFSGIDPRIRPSVNTSAPTNVYVDLNLISLREIDQTEQYFVINAWLEMSWQDDIRSWDPNQHGGVRFVYPGISGMWRPRVIVTNSIEDRDVFANDPSPLNLAWDGTARWYPGTVFYLSCTMDMTFFPFDRQNCSINFLSQEYGTDVVLIPVANSVSTGGYGAHGEWELESTSSEYRLMTFGGISFSRLYYHFIFRRQPAFYLLNVIVPVVLMSLLTPLVFVLPEESGERVSYSVTMLLSLSVFMGIVAGQLPQSSEPLPVTVVYLFVLLIHSGMCVVCTVIHLKWEQWKVRQQQARVTPEPLQDPQYKQYDSQGQNSHIAIEDPTVTGQSKEETQERNHTPKNKTTSRPCSFLSQIPLSANMLLIVIFYVIWFAFTLYYFVRILAKA